MKDKIYIPGREDLSVTVFIPTDCTNNCRFCTSKASYSEKKPDLKKVIYSIKDFCKNDPLAKYVKSFVITGGEPFANLDVLSEVLKAIPKKYKIYVNSSVPTAVYTEKKLAKYINKSRIDALNISRHGINIDKDRGLFSNDIASDEFITKIEKPIKINSITSENDDFLEKIKRWSKYKNTSLSLRADYRYIKPEDLKTLDCKIVNSILNIKNVNYVNHGGCDVCFNVTFERNGYYFSYHRGLKKSSVPFGNDKYLIVNDIIIYQDGKTSYDWL